MMNKLNRIWESTLVVFIFLFGFWYFCLRILGHQLQYVPGDFGDSRFINYLLEHGYCWLSGKSESFWSAPFLHPFQNSIALSDSMLGTQVFYYPWRVAGFSTETAYQAWWMCICCLNFWVSFWCFKQFFKSKYVAAILAYLFAFSVFNLGQLNYMQFMIRFPVPLAFYASYRCVSQVSLKYLAIYCFAVVYQFYCLPYIGFYLFYFSLLFVFVYLFITKSFSQTIRPYFNKQNRIKTLVLLLASGLLLGFYLMPYVAITKIVGLRLYKEVLPHVPNLWSYLIVHESSWLWNPLLQEVRNQSGEWWLYHLFPGALLLITLVFSIFYYGYKTFTKQNLSPLLKSILLVSAILCLLHLRVGDKATLYALIFKFPGINSMRVLNRFMQLELFLLIFILGYFVRKIPSYWLPLLFVLVVVDNSFDATKIQRQTKQELIQQKEQLISEIKSHPDFPLKTLAVIDTTQPAFQTQLSAMLAAQALGIKTINGYSSYCPDAYGNFFNTCSQNGLSAWIKNQQLNPDSILIIQRKPQ